MSVLAVLAAAGCSSSSKPDAAAPTTSTQAPSPSSTSQPLNTAVAVPTVTGPITGGSAGLPVNAMLASYKTQYGYREAEYFVEGTATAYHESGQFGEDVRCIGVVGRGVRAGQLSDEVRRRGFRHGRTQLKPRGGLKTS